MNLIYPNGITRLKKLSKSFYLTIANEILNYKRVKQKIEYTLQISSYDINKTDNKIAIFGEGFR